MEDIEYLEEYEDLVLPLINVPSSYSGREAKIAQASPAATITTTDVATVYNEMSIETDSSSSLDQDVFNCLFDDHSDEENETKEKETVKQPSIMKCISPCDTYTSVNKCIPASVGPPHASVNVINTGKLTKITTKSTTKLIVQKVKQEDKSLVSSSNYEINSNLSNYASESQPLTTIIKPEKHIGEDPITDPLNLDDDNLSDVASDLLSLSDISGHTINNLSDFDEDENIYEISSSTTLPASTKETRSFETSNTNQNDNLKVITKQELLIKRDENLQLVNVVSETHNDDDELKELKNYQHHQSRISYDVGVNNVKSTSDSKSIGASSTSAVRLIPTAAAVDALTAKPFIISDAILTPGNAKMLMTECQPCLLCTATMTTTITTTTDAMPNVGTALQVNTAETLVRTGNVKNFSHMSDRSKPIKIIVTPVEVPLPSSSIPLDERNIIPKKDSYPSVVIEGQRQEISHIQDVGAEIEIDCTHNFINIDDNHNKLTLEEPFQQRVNILQSQYEANTFFFEGQQQKQIGDILKLSPPLDKIELKDALVEPIQDQETNNNGKRTICEQQQLIAVDKFEIPKKLHLKTSEDNRIGKVGQNQELQKEYQKQPKELVEGEKTTAKLDYTKSSNNDMKNKITVDVNVQDLNKKTTKKTVEEIPKGLTTSYGDIENKEEFRKNVIILDIKYINWPTQFNAQNTSLSSSNKKTETNNKQNAVTANTGIEMSSKDIKINIPLTSEVVNNIKNSNEYNKSESLHEYIEEILPTETIFTKLKEGKDSRLSQEFSEITISDNVNKESLNKLTQELITLVPSIQASTSSQTFCNAEKKKCFPNLETSECSDDTLDDDLNYFKGFDEIIVNPVQNNDDLVNVNDVTSETAIYSRSDSVINKIENTKNDGDQQRTNQNSTKSISVNLNGANKPINTVDIEKRADEKEEETIDALVVAEYKQIIQNTKEARAKKEISVNSGLIDDVQNENFLNVLHKDLKKGFVNVKSSTPVINKEKPKRMEPGKDIETQSVLSEINERCMKDSVKNDLTEATSNKAGEVDISQANIKKLDSESWSSAPSEYILKNTTEKSNSKPEIKAIQDSSVIINETKNVTNHKDKNTYESASKEKEVLLNDFKSQTKCEACNSLRDVKLSNAQINAQTSSLELSRQSRHSPNRMENITPKKICKTLIPLPAKAKLESKNAEYPLAKNFPCDILPFTKITATALNAKPESIKEENIITEISFLKEKEPPSAESDTDVNKQTEEGTMACAIKSACFFKKKKQRSKLKILLENLKQNTSSISKQKAAKIFKSKPKKPLKKNSKNLKTITKIKQILGVEKKIKETLVEQEEQRCATNISSISVDDISTSEQKQFEKQQVLSKVVNYKVKETCVKKNTKPFKETTIEGSLLPSYEISTLSQTDNCKCITATTGSSVRILRNREFYIAENESSKKILKEPKTHSSGNNVIERDENAGLSGLCEIGLDGDISVSQLSKIERSTNKPWIKTMGETLNMNITGGRSDDSIIEKFFSQVDENLDNKTKLTTVSTETKMKMLDKKRNSKSTEATKDNSVINSSVISFYEWKQMFRSKDPKTVPSNASAKNIGESRESKSKNKSESKGTVLKTSNITQEVQVEKPTIDTKMSNNIKTEAALQKKVNTNRHSKLTKYDSNCNEPTTKSKGIPISPENISEVPKLKNKRSEIEILVASWSKNMKESGIELLLNKSESEKRQRRSKSRNKHLTYNILQKEKGLDENFDKKTSKNDQVMDDTEAPNKGTILSSESNGDHISNNAGSAPISNKNNLEKVHVEKIERSLPNVNTLQLTSSKKSDKMPSQPKSTTAQIDATSQGMHKYKRKRIRAPSSRRFKGNKKPKYLLHHLKVVPLVKMKRQRLNVQSEDVMKTDLCPTTTSIVSEANRNIKRNLSCQECKIPLNRSFVSKYLRENFHKVKHLTSDRGHKLASITTSMNSIMESLPTTHVRSLKKFRPKYQETVQNKPRGRYSNTSTDQTSKEPLKQNDFQTITVSQPKNEINLNQAQHTASHGEGALDHCCPNLSGPVPAINPTCIHNRMQVPVRELPAYVVLDTKILTHAELENDSLNLPNIVRQKMLNYKNHQIACSSKLSTMDKETSSSAKSSPDSNRQLSNIQCYTQLRRLDNILKKFARPYDELTFCDRQRIIESLLATSKFQTKDIEVVSLFLEEYNKQINILKSPKLNTSTSSELMSTSENRKDEQITIINSDKPGSVKNSVKNVQNVSPKMKYAELRKYEIPIFDAHGKIIGYQINMTKYPSTMQQRIGNKPNLVSEPHNIIKDTALLSTEVSVEAKDSLILFKDGAIRENNNTNQYKKYSKNNSNTHSRSIEQNVCRTRAGRVVKRPAIGSVNVFHNSKAMKTSKSTTSIIKSINSTLMPPTGILVNTSNNTSSTLNVITSKATKPKLRISTITLSGANTSDAIDVKKLSVDNGVALERSSESLTIPSASCVDTEATSMGVTKRLTRKRAAASSKDMIASKMRPSNCVQGYKADDNR